LEAKFYPKQKVFLRLTARVKVSTFTFSEMNAFCESTTFELSICPMTKVFRHVQTLPKKPRASPSSEAKMSKGTRARAGCVTKREVHNDMNRKGELCLLTNTKKVIFCAFITGSM
jgi:hypothetical protein